MFPAKNLSHETREIRMFRAAACVHPHTAAGHSGEGGAAHRRHGHPGWGRRRRPPHGLYQEHRHHPQRAHGAHRSTQAQPATHPQSENYLNPQILRFSPLPCFFSGTDPRETNPQVVIIILYRSTVDSPQIRHPQDPDKPVDMRTCLFQDRFGSYDSASVAAKTRTFLRTCPFQGCKI
jgi:hypothetical protein